VSRCTDATHAEQRWLYTLAPDLSDLRSIGASDVGEFLNCPRCSTTLLIPAVLDPLPASPALRVTL
jgi:hypothetical protein